MDNAQQDELARVLQRSEAAQTSFTHNLAFHRQTASDLLAAGYSKPRAIRASDEGLRTRLVDLLLAYKGTPRHKLFEYPHRDDDSQAMIRQAEAVALRITHALDATEAAR